MRALGANIDKHFSLHSLHSLHIKYTSSQQAGCHMLPSFVVLPSVIVPCDALMSSLRGVDSVGLNHVLPAVSGINAAVKIKHKINRMLDMWKKAWYVPKELVVNSWVKATAEILTVRLEMARESTTTTADSGKCQMDPNGKSRFPRTFKELVLEVLDA